MQDRTEEMRLREELRKADPIKALIIGAELDAKALADAERHNPGGFRREGDYGEGWGRLDSGVMI